MSAHRTAVTPRPGGPRHSRAAEVPAWGDIPNANGPDNGVSPTVPNDDVLMGPDNFDYDLLHAQPWSGWRSDWGTPYLEGRGFDEWSGYGFGRKAGADAYMGRVSTVMTCVDLNSRQLASFPVYGLQGYRPVELPEWRRTPQPDLYSSWDDFIKTAVNTYQLHGEVVMWALSRYANGYPRQFAVVNPAVLRIEWDQGIPRYLLGEDELDRSDLLHIKYQQLPNSPHGIGPLEWLGRSLTSASALEKYAADIAQQGVWAVLKHPSNLSGKQSTDLQNRWVAARRRADGAPAVLSGGVDLELMSLSPKDMALLDLRIFDEQRICAAFGVPPFLIGLPQPGGMTYANACVTDDTEILTMRGWLTVDEVSTDDWVLTLDHDTGLSEWQKPSAINVWDVEDGDELIRMEPQSHSSVSTPNHRWPVLRATAGGLVREWTTSAELNSQHRLILAAPSSQLSSDPKWTDEFVELVAWFYTEGHYHPGVNRSWAAIAQSSVRNPENVVAIRRCLTALLGPARSKGTTDHAYVRTFGDEPCWVEDHSSNGMISFRLNHEATSMLAGVMNDLERKVVGRDFIHSLTLAQLHLFIDTSVAADGCSTIGRKGDGRVFIQSDPERTDIFELACILAGIAISRRPHGDGTTRTGIKKRTTCTPVRASKQAVADGKTPTIERVDGTGKRVWCPTTPNGTWFARRDGQTYFTGNTSLFDFHWRATLRPIAQSFADAMSNWLLPRGTVIEFNPDRYVQPGFTERVAAYKTMNEMVDPDGNPGMTVSEARVAERLMPYADYRGPGSTAEPGDPSRYIDAQGVFGANP